MYCCDDDILKLKSKKNLYSVLFILKLDYSILNRMLISFHCFSSIFLDHEIPLRLIVHNRFSLSRSS